MGIPSLSCERMVRIVLHLRWWCLLTFRIGKLWSRSSSLPICDAVCILKTLKLNIKNRGCVLSFATIFPVDISNTISWISKISNITYFEVKLQSIILFSKWKITANWQGRKIKCLQFVDSWDKIPIEPSYAMENGTRSSISNVSQTLCCKYIELHVLDLAIIQYKYICVCWIWLIHNKSFLNNNNKYR